MISPPVTIKEIARMLGVSKSTVSRALTRQADVNAETRRKVLELAQKLNYEPNTLALNLRHKRTMTLGVIIPETINTFFSRVVGGIQKTATLEGYNVIVCQSNESQFAEKDTLHSLITNHADGLLISISRDTKNDEHFNELVEKNIPWFSSTGSVNGLQRLRWWLTTSRFHHRQHNISSTRDAGASPCSSDR